MLGVGISRRREGAKDFFWKAEIKELDQEDIALDIHHIFPQDRCEKQGIKRDTYNAIINKTPNAYKANRKIGGHAPSVYLRKLQDEKTVQLSDEDMNALVASHGIAATTLCNDDFEAHYQARKSALFGLIRKVMGSGQ